jgi:predicted nucleic acid-binding protein
LPDLLLDTNAVSAAMAGREALDRYLAHLTPNTRLLTSVVVEAEIRFGLARLPSGRRRQQLSEAFDRILDTLHGILPVTRQTTSHYAMMKSEQWKRGQPIGDNDIWIAATAVAEGLTVLTSDTHFREFSNLQVDDWSSA